MVKSENAQLLVDGKPVENDYTFTTKDSKNEKSKWHLLSMPASLQARSLSLLRNYTT